MTTPASPEHIVILPSPQEEDAPGAAGTASSNHSHVPPSHHGSQPHSRTPTARSVQHPQPIRANGAYTAVPAQQSTVHAPSPRHAYDTSHASRAASHSPALAFSQSQPLSGAHGGAPSRPSTILPYAYSPPAIVYAPSGRNGSQYAPPQIVYSPSSHGHSRHSSQHPSQRQPQHPPHHPPYPRGQAPGSIAYSQSDPLPLTHSQHGMTTAPPNPRIVIETNRSHNSHARVHSRSQSVSRCQSVSQGQSANRSQSVSRSQSINTSHHGGHSRRGRSPIRSRSPSRSPTPSDDAGSHTSGSTYYILPTPGQKVQIIVSVILVRLDCER